ncbi:MAG: cytochrome C oxidase subunit IV family protein [Chitinophagales bacterium]
MEHANVATEITIHHEPSGSTKRIWKVFWILLIITMVELGLGLSLYALNLPEGLRQHLIKGVIIVLSLAKAYYIVSVFMHLGDEIRNMIMTIVVPLTLFIWFILAFIYDGNSYKNLRNKYDRFYKERTIVARPGKDTVTVKPGGKD